VFAAFGFAARLRKICKNKTLRLLGYHRSLFFCIVIIIKLYFIVYKFLPLSIHFDIKERAEQERKAREEERKRKAAWSQSK
jgi:hypothetical protein